MDPIITGGLISAGSKLLGGIFGSKQAKKDRAYALMMDNTKIQRMSADAKAAGIHPLAALGGGVSYSGGVSGGSSPIGEAISNIGGDIGQTLSQRSMAKAQLALIDSQINKNNKESEAALMEATALTKATQLRAMSRGATTGSQTAGPGSVTRPLGPTPDDLSEAVREANSVSGTPENVEGISQTVTDAQGNTAKQIRGDDIGEVLLNLYRYSALKSKVGLVLLQEAGKKGLDNLQAKRDKTVTATDAQGRPWVFDKQAKRWKLQ